MPSLVLEPELTNEFYVRFINVTDGNLIPIVVKLNRPSYEFIEGDSYPCPSKPERIVQSVKRNIHPLVMEELDVFVAKGVKSALDSCSREISVFQPSCSVSYPQQASS